MKKLFKGRMAGDQFMPATDASLTDYVNSALPSSSNVEQALDTMILNINSAIVESGSNEKGRYTKYADGTMIQHGKALVPVSSTFTSGNKTVELPMKMLVGYNVLFSNIYSFSNKVMWSSARVIETSFDIYAQSQDTLQNKHYFEAYWTAFGRWKEPSTEPYKPVYSKVPAEAVLIKNKKGVEIHLLDYIDGLPKFQVNTDKSIIITYDDDIC